MTEVQERVLVNEPPVVASTSSELQEPVAPVTKGQPREPKPGWVTSIKNKEGKGLTRPQMKHTGKGSAPRQAPSTPSTPPAQVIPVAEVVMPVENAPTPVPQPVHLPSQEPVAVAPVTIVVEPSSTIPVAPRVLALESDDDLIHLPGEKPKTVRQYKAEQAQLRDLDRKRGEIGYREKQLNERYDQLDQRIAQIGNGSGPQAGTPAPQQQTIAPPTPTGPPARPAGAIEGDPEWADWQGQLAGYYSGLQVEAKIAPLREELAQVRNEREASGRAEAEARARFDRNDAVYSQALMEHLPFNPAGLSEDAIAAINDRVHQVAQGVGLGLDKTTLTTKDLTPDVAALLVQAAFPPGSLPPGYTASPTMQPQQPAPPVQPSQPQLQVPKQPPQPLHSPSVPMAPAAPPGRTRSQSSEGNWLRGLKGQTSLQPVTIRRSGVGR